MNSRWTPRRETDRIVRSPSLCALPHGPKPEVNRSPFYGQTRHNICFSYLVRRKPLIVRPTSLAHKLGHRNRLSAYCLCRYPRMPLSARPPVLDGKLDRVPCTRARWHARAPASGLTPSQPRPMQQTWRQHARLASLPKQCEWGVGTALSCLVASRTARDPAKRGPTTLHRTPRARRSRKRAVSGQKAVGRVESSPERQDIG